MLPGWPGRLGACHLKPDPAGSLQLSAYPSQQDRQKIQAFLAEYGPRFLPGTLSSVPSQVYRNPRGDGTTVTLIPPGSPDDPLDFFSEFAQQYHFFKWTEMILMRRLFPGPSPIDASGDLWELAIAVLRCALPPCGNTFFPLRKDQTCCGPAHAGRLRVQHSRRKHARQ